MRTSLLALVVLVVVSVGCGDDPKGQSVCDNQVPAPLECMTQCDPAPGAATTCPGGYHCTPDGTCDAFCTGGGGECGDGYRCTPDGRCVGDDACVGLECNIVACEKMGMPSTTISGTVFAPNGTLPLFGIDVYVPNVPLGPPQDGAICDRCSNTLPGYPLSRVQTDEAGKFVLTGVPSGTDVPVIISSGKWRRTITIPAVAPCADTPLAAADTHLPKNQSEGYMPAIAISTGGADAIECLGRKLGIDDEEFDKSGGTGRIHLYTDGGAGGGEGANKFRSGFPGGTGDFADSTTLWNDVNKLKSYDIVILSCEGSQHPETKSQAALDAMKAYADFGGRVFMSHWHNIWIGGEDGNPSRGIPEWQSIVDFDFNAAQNESTQLTIVDESSNPKGASYATWLLNVAASTVRDEIVVAEPRYTAQSIDMARAERWVYVDPARSTPQGRTGIQNLLFTTPNLQPPNERCGKVVFSDMHVSGDSSSRPGTPFPNDCSNTALTPQEKALAFIFFDIASCVSGPIF